MTSEAPGRKVGRFRFVRGRIAVTNRPMRFRLILAAPLLALATPTLAQPATAPAAAAPQSLQQQVESVLATAPAGTRFGLLVTGPDGREIVAIDPDQRFIPASNTKLFTTAAALSLLSGSSLPDRSAGTLVKLRTRREASPDVLIYGRGDGRMSSGAECKVDCLAVLADAVAARTRRVNAVIGDATAFPDQRWSPGMSWNNIGTDSGTAISALTLDDNELPIVVTPTKPDRPPQVAVSAYLTVHNEAVTVAAGKRDIRFETTVNGRELRVYGQIPVGEPYRDKLGIDDPALYTAWTFQNMLQLRGVRVQRAPASRYQPVGLRDDPAYRPLNEITVADWNPALAELEPPPLIDDVMIVNKVSQNLHAELLLRRIGRIEGTGSLADGILALGRMLAAAGVPRAGYDFSDGSGMSSYNRVSPRAAVALLRWGQAQPWGAAWRASFPVGGTDGTLKRRFAGTPLEGKLWAKTGTLNASNALSGYLQAASGQELTFSIFANDVPEDKGATGPMDAALALIAAAN